MFDNEEFFGSPEKIALMRRSASLWYLVKDMPQYAYYGRLVRLGEPAEDTADVLSSLARLQGAAVCHYYPQQSANELFSDLERRGFSTDRHELYWGGQTAHQASREVLAAHVVPNDLTVSAIDGDTPRELLIQVADLCASCDVMTVPGSIMRGQVLPGINLVATDAEGRPVATASSYKLYHPSSPHAKTVFWGMLATREDRRGEKIALLLGAQAIIHMWDHHGARGFMTGVRSDNLSSQRLCNKLGVADTEWIYAWCIDRAVLGTSTITK